MMNAPFTRMFWKEYRSLRMLWVGVMLGTFALCGLILLLHASGNLLLHATARYRAADSFITIWSMTFWLPSLYVIGCAAAMFAGEREERTADWLIQLAAPARPILSAKILWAFSSAAVMQLILFGLAEIVFHVLMSGSPEAESYVQYSKHWSALVLLEALAWGSLLSLLISKPLGVAVGAAVCLVIVNGVTAVLDAGAQVHEPWGWAVESIRPVRLCLLLGLLIADVVLAHWWLAGRSWNWTRFELRFPVLRAAAAKIPAIEPRTAWQRSWQRLAWLEWQRVRIFLLFSVLGVVLSLTPFIWNGFHPNGMVVVIAIFLSLCAGLSAWQGEHSRQQFRFLVNHGISPFALWLNKLGIWFVGVILSSMGVMLLLMLVTFLQLWITGRANNAAYQLQALWQIPPADVATFLWLWVVTYVGSFVVSLYFRRAIFAIAAGFFLEMILVNWVIFPVSVLELPAWFVVGLIILWLLWCGLRQLPRWSLEQTGWKAYANIAADWLVFPSLFAAVVVAYFVA